MSTRTVEYAKKILKDNGAVNFEVIPLKTPLSHKHYQTWLEKGQQAEMDYMKNSKPRQKPREHFRPMKSIFVFQETYLPEPEIKDKTKKTFFKNLKIALYARQKDYHIWFKDKLVGYIKKLEEKFPEEVFVAFTDSVPLLERDCGYRAGLGWVGKNTCLIHPKRGSFFFIGEILSSLESSNTPQTLHDFCGSCTACMEACPTGAIKSERVLDANLCLAYWNIESKKVPPHEIRQKMDSWFFGCDICQNVCPWNIKLHSGQFQKETKDRKSVDFNSEKIKTRELEKELCFILENSNKKLMKFFRNSPLGRAGGRGLKRNALIVIANNRLVNLKPQVEKFLSHESLGELACWTLDQLGFTTDKIF